MTALRMHYAIQFCSQNHLSNRDINLYVFTYSLQHYSMQCLETILSLERTVKRSRPDLLSKSVNFYH